MKDLNKNDLLQFDPAAVKEKIIRFIRRYAIDLNRDGALVGLSGGLDSCLVLRLCVEALGNENVKAVIMPERDSSRTHISDAKRFAASMSVDYILKNISPILWWLGVYRLYPPAFLFPKKVQARFAERNKNNISKKLEKDVFLANLCHEKDERLNRGKAFYRIKHRLRSSILFYYSELYNMLLVGTSNKSEVLTGFFVKYGDNIADIMPLSFLFKTQVKTLARNMKLEASIIDKPPSPDLIPGIVDEDMLEISYEKLDKVLSALEHNMDDFDIIETTGVSVEEIIRVKQLMTASEYLRTWPINL